MAAPERWDNARTATPSHTYLHTPPSTFHPGPPFLQTMLTTLRGKRVRRAYGRHSNILTNRRRASGDAGRLLYFALEPLALRALLLPCYYRRAPLLYTRRAFNAATTAACLFAAATHWPPAAQTPRARDVDALRRALAATHAHTPRSARQHFALAHTPCACQTRCYDVLAFTFNSMKHATAVAAARCITNAMTTINNGNFRARLRATAAEQHDDDD